MKLRHCSTAAAMVLTALATAAFSGPPSQEMPNADWDFTSAKLMNDGYTQIRMVSEASRYMVAFDPEGSEVLLLIDPKKHAVLSSTYVHPGDK